MKSHSEKATPKWLHRLQMLFYLIAEHEMNIEHVRTELSENDEFSPKGLFRYLKGQRSDGKVGTT